MMNNFPKLYTLKRPATQGKALPKGGTMEANERFIRLDELISKTGLGRSTIIE